MIRSAVLVGIVVALAACVPPPNPVHYRGIPTIGDRPPDRDSSAPDLSADGRYMTFTSSATNLVPDDANDTGFGASDVFVWDTSTGGVRRTPAIGGEPDAASASSYISGDGRFVVFTSSASNLVVGDSNGVRDVFVWDTVIDEVRRQPSGVGSGEPNADSFVAGVSGDGRFVAFTSSASNLVVGDSNGVRDVFVWDTVTDEVRRQPRGVGAGDPNGESTSPAISGDGRFVAFTSSATNIAPGDSTGTAHVFVWNLGTDMVKRQPNGVDGEQQNAAHWFPSMSGDGRTVVFTSSATNLTPGRPGSGSLYVWNTEADTLTRSPRGVDGRQPDNWSSGSTSSTDGRVVAFTTLANNLARRNGVETQGLYKVYLWVRP